MSEQAEKQWWDQYGKLESRIWAYNQVLHWIVRGGYLREMRAFLYKPGGRVLDVGCGDGWLSLYLAQTGMQVDGIDLSETQIRLARERAAATGARNVQFRRASTADLSGEARYNGAVIHATLHHLDSQQRRALLRQIEHLLRPRGRLYVYEPLAPQLPAPKAARLLDAGVGRCIRGLKAVARGLYLTDPEIRQAVREGWTMRSPNEAPIVLAALESELPNGLRVRRVHYWHVFAVAYANFCMELKPLWQALFTPGVLVFSLLDWIVGLSKLATHLHSWPMSAIMVEKSP